MYQRLTGRKRTLAGFSQLWIAPDHLLLVRSTRFTERYQRFAFGDIQAIVVTELPDQTALKAVALALLLAGAAGFFGVSSVLAKIAFALMALIGLLMVIAYIAPGKRCMCHLHTAVSRELLSPVADVRTARKFLASVRPEIEAAQGTLAPDRLAAAEAIQTPVEKAPELPRAPGYLPEALFGVFLINALLVVLSARFPQAQISSVLFTTIFGEMVILIVALIRRAGRDSRRFIYAVMIAALLCTGFDAFHLTESFIDWTRGVLQSAQRRQPTPNPYAWIAFAGNGVVFAAIWRICAGTIGLAAAWLER